MGCRLPTSSSSSSYFSLQGFPPLRNLKWHSAAFPKSYTFGANGMACTVQWVKLTFAWHMILCLYISIFFLARTPMISLPPERCSGQIFKVMYLSICLLG